MSQHDDPLRGKRVRIVDKEHPHYPETGVFTGQMISLLGELMAEVRLDHCQHGTDGCFISKGQVELLR